MSIETLKEEFLDAGFHEESTERALEHFQEMRVQLGRGNYVNAGAHVGNFCENVVNILRDQMGEGTESNVEVGTFVDHCTCGNIGNSEPREIRLTIPRMIRAAYELRNARDSVHVNLEVEVNHSDTQAAVRTCSWILAELLRAYGDEDDMDEIADLIEELARPLTPYIDEHNGDRMIQHTELGVREEVLIHLHSSTGEVDADDLVDWIPGEDSRSVKGALGRLKQDRKVWYDNDEGTARIASLGAEEAREIEAEHFFQSSSSGD